MGSLKDNFIKKFIMSLLWSVDKPEGSEKPEKSPENLENSDSEGEEKSPEKKSTEEREKSKSPVEDLEDSDSDIEIVFEVKAPPKTSSKPRSESEYSDDSDSEIEEILPNGRPNLGLGGTVSPDKSDSESENGVEKDTPTKDTPKTERKNLKRPIASENSDQSEDEAKRTKCSSIRNEISSSLSSSSQKKRTADSADFDSEDDGDEVDYAPKKVLKSDETVKKTDETVEKTDEKADELMPVQKSSTTKSKKFSKVVSPKKKNLKHVSIEKEAGDSNSENSEESDNLEKGEKTDKLLVKKDVITDAKALLADQEKSEERGKKLLEAFDD